jgi:hydroxyethylthiazole kinase-like uncharacterized protein yjeF
VSAPLERAPQSEERSLQPPNLPDDAHKGTAGRVLCVVGSRWMPGAAILVARAASRAGAGLVTVGARDSEVLAHLPAAAPEAVLLDLSGADRATYTLGRRRDHALVFGCGLGQDEVTRALLQSVFASNLACPLVVDADGLNVLGTEPERLRDYRGAVVITPHPGEAARLLGREVSADDGERAAAARELAKRSGALCCLKGRRTVVADAEHLYVNDTGNPGMATAGTGDVLAGILGAYLALVGTGAFPAWTALDAVCAAVRVHGLAGDMGAAHLGRRALVASDLIAWLPAAQRRLEG